MTYFTSCRYADDEDLNEELKEKERWNDPAAGFLTVSPLVFLLQEILTLYDIEEDHYHKRKKINQTNLQRRLEAKSFYDSTWL